MPGNKSIKLHIPIPCHEDWGTMTPQDRGRFCGQCQKTVVDFTTWSDKDIISFFNEYTGKVCGKFLNSQLKRELQLPPQPKSKLYKLAIACGLTLMFAQIPQTHAMVKQPVEIITDANEKEQEGNPEKITLTGKIVDEGNNIVPHATVSIYQLHEEIATVISNIDGSFSVDLLPGTYRISAKYAQELYGYSSVQITGNCQKQVDVIVQMMPPMLGMVGFDRPTTKGEIVGTPNPKGLKKYARKAKRR